MKLANISSKFRADLIVKTYLEWINPKDRVLDVGCGNGVVTAYLAHRFKVKIYGCDIENYLIKKINFTQMTDEYVLPFKSNSFDVIMLNDVLHHLPKNKQYLILKESKRVGKKVLLFEVYPNLIGKYYDFVINKIHNPNMRIPWSFRDVHGWEQLFKKNRLKSETVVVPRPLLYPVQHLAFKLER